MTEALDRVDSDAVAELLACAGYPDDGAAVEGCPGGGNNRVYLIRTRAARFIVKWYFRHRDDARDRLGAEFRFLQYAFEVGCRQVPRPLAALPREGLALYEFVEGRKLALHEIQPGHVRQAASFLAALNDRGRPVSGADLPEASEARFSLDAHIALVNMRVDRLEAIDGAAPEDIAAKALVAEIGGLLDRRADAIREAALSFGLDPTADLPESMRCVSPSDFGFHNALLRPSGELCFLDFEYAGRDDPAKMINDFFWQPAIPPPLQHYDSFLERCVAYAEDPQWLALRVRTLRPLFGLKWCCILLNEFLPAAAQRRRFAGLDLDLATRKQAQLAKVRRLIDSHSL